MGDDVNVDGNGAAIWVRYSTLAIHHSTFINNTMTNRGGALYAKDMIGPIRITHCVLLDHNVAEGAGVYAHDEPITCGFQYNPLIISDTVIARNKVKQNVTWCVL